MKVLLFFLFFFIIDFIVIGIPIIMIIHIIMKIEELGMTL